MTRFAAASSQTVELPAPFRTAAHRSHLGRIRGPLRSYADVRPGPDCEIGWTAIEYMKLGDERVRQADRVDAIQAELDAAEITIKSVRASVSDQIRSQSLLDGGRLRLEHERRLLTGLDERRRVLEERMSAGVGRHNAIRDALTHGTPPAWLTVAAGGYLRDSDAEEMVAESIRLVGRRVAADDRPQPSGVPIGRMPASWSAPAGFNPLAQDELRREQEERRAEIGRRIVDREHIQEIEEFEAARAGRRRD